MQYDVPYENNHREKSAVILQNEGLVLDIIIFNHILSAMGNWSQTSNRRLLGWFILSDAQTKYIYYSNKERCWIVGKYRQDFTSIVTAIKRVPALHYQQMLSFDKVRNWVPSRDLYNHTALGLGRYYKGP